MIVAVTDLSDTPDPPTITFTIMSEEEREIDVELDVSENYATFGWSLPWIIFVSAGVSGVSRWRGRGLGHRRVRGNEREQGTTH